MAGQGYNNRRGLRLGEEYSNDPMMFREPFGGDAEFNNAPYEEGDASFQTAGKQEDASDDSAYDQGWSDVDEAEFMKWLRSQPPGLQQRLLDSYRYGSEDAYGAMGDDEYYPSYRRRSNRDGAFGVPGEPGSPNRERFYQHHFPDGDRPGDLSMDDDNMRDDGSTLGGRAPIDDTRRDESRPTRRRRTPRLPSEYER